ncbi:hypothetical protein B0J14DRAFT_660923 [Halenospora varia]|nr:hypothetical protein B0J14DRAFT_660923 [Halenospora varia]
MVQHAHHPIYNDIDRRSLVWRTICYDSQKGLNSEDHSFDKDGKEVEETGTRLYITENGYFGIVPIYAKEGDQIWAFSGAPNPFVLRASSNSAESQATKTYQLVGVCYVDGIMHGELERAGLEPMMVNLA